LRYERFIEISQPGAMPLTAGALRADERIVSFLKGLNEIDDRLGSFIEPAAQHEGVTLSQSQHAVVENILRRLNPSEPEATLPVVQLAGADMGSRLAVSQSVGLAVNRRIYRLRTESLPSTATEIETLARLWQRESFLLPVAIYVDTENLDGVHAEASAALQRFLAHPLGLVFVGVRETPLRLSSATFNVEVNKPTAAEQCTAWTAELHEIKSDISIEHAPKILAGQFNLSLAEIREATAVALNRTLDDSALVDQIWAACRNLTRPRLDSLAQRLEPKATWSDLVLPDEQMSLMRQIAGHVRERYKVYDEWGFAQTMNRGFGISALFAGESGTGKTMAAEVLANDLQLNLYRIDLSAVVSKYIGETEKNLRTLFDAAERGGAILFFDEADALFGKRSEVKDSHDRYANIEINYLLQRMEAFSGLAILATNMKSALDAAFMRRLRFIVNLPFPGMKERKLIWQKALPPETPTRDLDFDRLARLNISGGNIHSIALNAAFIAAQNGQTVTMPILFAAARGELRKLERPVNDAEFRVSPVAGSRS
jgi:ATP-dependent 26S proteasome regulatory subunit